MRDHPFLQTNVNPVWSTLTPEHIREDISIALEQAEQKLESIRKLQPEETTFENSI